MPALYDYLENQRRVRHAILDAKKEVLDTENSKRDEVLDYFDGIDSHAILRGYYASRYAYRLAKEVDSASGSESYKYAKGQAPQAVEQGLYQIAETKTLHRVVRSVATLFTQPDQRFEFVGVDPLPESTSILQEMRKAGDYLGHLLRTDRVSVLLGSSAIRVSHQGGKLVYEGGIGPQCVWILWPEMITDGESERGVNKADLEDAAAVIVKLEDSGSAYSNYKNSKYIAYFGRSQDYEHGRMVTYWASSPYDIPPIGDPGVIEYEVPSVGPCNPLTYMQDTVDDGVDLCPHEYPIAVLHGQDTTLATVFPPTSFSLYDNAIEIDLLQSRILKAADVAARGSIAVFLDQGGVPPENPDEGVCIMPRGARREITAVPSSGVTDAAEALKLAQLQLATGYGVPGYEVISDGTGQPESGIALAIRSQPKKEARQERVNAARSAIQRLYHIERGLCRWFGDDDQWIPEEVEQVWYAGTWQPPMSATERTAEIQAQYDLGVIDYIEAVRQAHGLADRDAAKALIDMMAEDSRQYKNPNKSPALRLPPRA